MNLNKKRVSFSHIAVPMNLRSESISSGSALSTNESIELNSVSDNPAFLPAPPTFKTGETIQISLKASSNEPLAQKELNADINYAQQVSVDSSIKSFQFHETRRRSHAFSVSAIDETLPVNMDGEYEYPDDETSQEGQSEVPSKASKSVNKSNRGKMFRAAEIPINGTNRVLICHTKNELINNKYFQHDIRAVRDLDWFLARPNVLIDCECNNMEMIIDQMLAVG